MDLIFIPASTGMLTLLKVGYGQPARYRELILSTCVPDSIGKLLEIFFGDITRTLIPVFEICLVKLKTCEAIPPLSGGKNGVTCRIFKPRSQWIQIILELHKQPMHL